MLIRAIRGKKPLILAILAVLCCLFIAFPVLAAGEGDGSGGGKDVPLALTSSNPANGQNNVPVTTDINLTFNKNVVNLAVKDNNMKCFSLSGNGISVPIQVVMPDDQVDFEHRRNIDINPLQNLKPGTVYKLVISGQMQAKNGLTLGSPVTISFTTTGTAQNTNAGQNTQTTSNIKSGSAESEQQTPAAEVKNKKTTDETKAAAKDAKENDEVKSKAKSENEDKESKTSGRGIAVAAGLAIIAAAGYGYYRYSHKK